MELILSPKIKYKIKFILSSIIKHGSRKDWFVPICYAAISIVMGGLREADALDFKEDRMVGVQYLLSRQQIERWSLGYMDRHSSAAEELKKRFLSDRNTKNSL